MPKEYKRKSDRATKYTKEDLEVAIQKVRDRELTNFAAAKLYGIPTSTLNDRVRQKTGLRSQTLGRPPAIPFELEAKLADSLRILEKWGWGLSRAEVMEIVAEFVRKNNLNTQFKDDKPGNEWFISFRRRHNLSIKKPQPVEYLRKRMTDPFVINEYFTLLEETLKKLELDDPNRMWNLDETSVSLDPTKTKVVGGVGLPCTRTTFGTGKENITVLTTVNAAGTKLNPLIVYKGKHVYDQWMAESKKEHDFEIAYAASKRGWMETEIFYNYMEKIVIPSLGEKRPVLIVYDGHCTHVDEKVVALAVKNDVTILKLPPHTSHLLQPLDLAVFKSLKSKWDQKVVQWQRQNIGLKIQKQQFAEMFAETWQNTSPTVIKNGFKKGGIYPFNSAVIPEEKYDPNALKRWQIHISQKITKSPKTLKQLCTTAINKTMGNTMSDLSVQKVATTSSNISEATPNQSTTASINTSFEELLLKRITQQTKKNPTTTVTKRTRVAKGAEVITYNFLEKQREKQLNINKEKESQPQSKKTRLKKPDTNATDYQVPGPSTENTEKKKYKTKETSKQIKNTKKTNLEVKSSTAKGKGVGKKTRPVKEKNEHDSGDTSSHSNLEKCVSKKRTKSVETRSAKRSKRPSSITTTPDSTQMSVHSDSDIYESLSDILFECDTATHDDIINESSQELIRNDEIERIIADLHENDQNAKETKLSSEEITGIQAERLHKEPERQISESNKENQRKPNSIKQPDNIKKSFKKEKITILSNIRNVSENQKFYCSKDSFTPIDKTFQLPKCLQDDSSKIEKKRIKTAKNSTMATDDEDLNDEKELFEFTKKITDSENKLNYKQNQRIKKETDNTPRKLSEKRAEDCNPQILRTYNAGDTVLARYYTKTWKHYVGVVQNFNQGAESYIICYYKTVGKNKNIKFIVPKREDKDCNVPRDNIVKELELHQISENPKEYTLVNDEDAIYF